VPLVVALPDGRYAGRRISEQVSLVDVLPTVLELAGIPSSLDFDGSSLVSLLEGKAAGRREAWSYAPKTNVGISLRVSNRLKYIYNNTAWVPPEGREELYRLDVDPNEESNVIATAPEAEGLRRLVRERLASGISGLRVQVANDGQKPLSGSLDAPFLRPWRVKVLDPPCTCLFWDDRAEALRFEVPAGEALALFLEGIGPGDFELKAQGEGSQTALDWRRDPQTLDGPQAFAFDGSSWTEVRPTSDRPSSTGIMVDWHGTGAVSSPYARDESMVKQLQALGYLN